MNKPLKDDETFNIRTSTMVVGIRGTSGLVTNDDSGDSGSITPVSPPPAMTGTVDANGGVTINGNVIGQVTSGTAYKMVLTNPTGYTSLIKLPLEVTDTNGTVVRVDRLEKFCNRMLRTGYSK